MPYPVTAADQFLEQISGQLAEQNELLGKLVGALVPDEPAADAPAAGEPEKPAARKAPAKKATTRKRVNGQ